jgi:PEGA domain
MWPRGDRHGKCGQTMRVRKSSGAHWLVVTIGVLTATHALADKSLWLVRPLYPGQEQLVARTEKALDTLMPGASRDDAVIGRKELAAALKGRALAELPCFGVDTRCADPIDPFVASLGFERIVLIQGGQDEAGFKFRVVAYEPGLGKVNPATATNANLERALLGAVAKVVPAASTLEVKSTPAGATVFIDDAKVGVTPLSTQVLPGERVVRIDLKLHQPVEESLIIPIRGAAVLERTLDKVAARIVVTASPTGTEISLDGVAVGKDKLDRGIAPGEHTLRLTCANHKAFEQTISVRADQQYALDKTLEPLPLPSTVGANAVAAPPPAPPKPATVEDLTYERRSYVHLSGEVTILTGSNLVGRRFPSGAVGRTLSFDPSVGPTLAGLSFEYGTFGKYFGIAVLGLSYLTNFDELAMTVGFEPGRSQEVNASSGVVGPTRVERVRVNLGVIRALQPQFRLALWRFQLALQVGVEFRSGHVQGVDPGGSTFYTDGFVPLDFMAAGRLNVNFFLVDGLFLHLQGNYAAVLISNEGMDETGHRFGSSNSVGFNLGVGYGF